jgi:hypothetical protein
MGNNFIKATGEIMTPETFKNPPKVGISGIIKELGEIPPVNNSPPLWNKWRNSLR